MSDDDCEIMEVEFKVRKPVVYGSLEEKERQRLRQQGSKSLGSSAIEAGKAAGNILITDGMFAGFFSVLIWNVHNILAH